MSAHSTYQPQSGFMKWLERRLPRLDVEPGAPVGAEGSA